MTLLTKQRITAVVIIIAVALLDWLTKTWALENLRGQVVPVIDGLFNVRLAFNTGVSFSMLGDVGVKYMPEILGTVAIVAAIGFTVWMFRSKENWLLIPALGLVVGGALGNGYDRFAYGAVVDFLDFYYDVHHWPTFNVADIAIVIGVGLLLVDSVIEAACENKENNS